MFVDWIDGKSIEIAESCVLQFYLCFDRTIGLCFMSLIPIGNICTTVKCF